MEELKKYVESINSIVFRMALSQLMVMGVENASKISDEDIENCKENDMMTKEFVQDLFRVTRELAKYEIWDILAYVKEYVGINGCTDLGRKSK